MRDVKMIFSKKKTKTGSCLNPVKEAQVQESFLSRGNEVHESFLSRARDKKPDVGPQPNPRPIRVQRDRHSKLNPRATSFLPSHTKSPTPTSFWPLSLPPVFSRRRGKHRAPARPRSIRSPVRPHRILPSPPSRRPDLGTLAQPGSIQALD